MRKKCTQLLILVALVVAGLSSLASVHGQDTNGSGVLPEGSVCADGTCGTVGYRPWEYGNPALFYNFYVGNQWGGAPAQLYIAPYPVPPFVGHTYYTYQPLMPHEFLYRHYRTYRKYYDGGRGIDRTRVIWYSNPLATVLKDARQFVMLPR